MDDANSKREVAEARVGRMLRGKWRLDALIGVGGMAAVYAATHRNGRRGAVKMLHPRMARELALRERFLQEGRAANEIEHPGVVAVLDDDEDETGSPFLVMELLEGESAAARMAARGALPWGEVRGIAEGLLEALAAAHDAGVVHRDIKPDNVFLCADGRVKLVDFGIARSAGGPSLTWEGDTLGTPAFMAPEQALGRWDEVGPVTDVWAVGATIFSLLTGRPVHEGRGNHDTLVLAATREAPPIATLLPLPASVAAFVDRALCRDASRRYPDARSMLAALRDASEVAPVTSPLALADTVAATAAGPLAPPRRGEGKLGLLGLALVVGLGLVAVRFFSPPPAANHAPAPSASGQASPAASEVAPVAPSGLASAPASAVSARSSASSALPARPARPVRAAPSVDLYDQRL